MRGMSDFDPAIWAPVPIAPMPMLAYLRVCVVSRSVKRMPKWKFRISADVVTQVRRSRSAHRNAAGCLRQAATGDDVETRLPVLAADHSPIRCLWHDGSAQSVQALRRQLRRSW